MEKWKGHYPQLWCRFLSWGEPKLREVRVEGERGSFDRKLSSKFWVSCRTGLIFHFLHLDSVCHLETTDDLPPKNEQEILDYKNIHAGAGKITPETILWKDSGRNTAVFLLNHEVCFFQYAGYTRFQMMQDLMAKPSAVWNVWVQYFYRIMKWPFSLWHQWQHVPGRSIWVHWPRVETSQFFPNITQTSLLCVLPQGLCQILR